MQNRIIDILRGVTWWALAAFPFTAAISNGLMNTCMGLIIAGFVPAYIVRRRMPARAIPFGILIPWLVFLGISAVSIAHSVNLRDSARGLFRFTQYLILMWIAASAINDRRHVRGILCGCAAGLAFASIDALWQTAAGFDFVRGNRPIVNIGLTRATAAFSDANVLGVYLSAFFPIPAAYALYHARGRMRIFFGAAAALGLIGILLTWSRPTLLAVYAVFVFLALVKKDKVIGCLLVAALVAFPFLLPRSVKEFARSVEYNPVRFMCNDDRIAVYRNSLNMIRRHPLTGLGVNTYMKNYRFYKESPEYRGVVTSDYMYAHNNFLQMAAETGLAGLSAFLWLLCALFRTTAGIYRTSRDPFLKTAGLGLIACSIAFLVNGLTESSLYYPRAAPIFWFIAGIALSLARVEYGASSA